MPRPADEQTETALVDQADAYDRRGPTSLTASLLFFLFGGGERERERKRMRKRKKKKKLEPRKKTGGGTSYLPEEDPNELSGDRASGSNVSASSHASVAARSLPRGAASPSPTLKHVSSSTEEIEAQTSLLALSARACAFAALETEEAQER